MSDKPLVVLCDLDGTLAIHNGRQPYDYDKCDTDIPNPAVLEVLLCLQTSPVVKQIIFVSGREDSCREKSQDWITRHTALYKPLIFMRKSGDYRKDFIVKEELYRNYIEPNYEVLFILDDRTQVVQAWRSLGLTVFQVAEGAF